MKLDAKLINYIVLLAIFIVFSITVLNIKLTFSEKKRRKQSNLSRIILPMISLGIFFVGCYFSARLVGMAEDGVKVSSLETKFKLPEFSGIYYMVIFAIILTIFNLTVLSKKNLDKYIKGKKFTVTGLFMALGVSAIVFGFLDNFGMKLGTDALDGTFLQLFLSPFSLDERFKEPHIRDSIKRNLKTMNEWTNKNWIKIVNQCTRFKSQIDKIPQLSDLSEVINEFEGDKIEIPPEVVSKDLVKPYWNNLKDKFSMIDGSKAMMGNTFSDFMGAILGAAIINLFIYSTSYDGVYTGDKTDDSFFVKNLNSYMPILEAFFISIGCLVPIFLNIAMVRKGANVNNKKSWYIVAGISIILLLMMFISAKGVKNMTTEDKRNSIKKTIESMKDRLDINSLNNVDETILEEQLDQLVKNI